MPLRSVTGQVGLDAYLEDDDGDVLGGTAHMDNSFMDKSDGVGIDLERSIGIRL